MILGIVGSGCSLPVVTGQDNVGGEVFGLVEVCVAIWIEACERFVQAIKVKFLRCCDAVYSDGQLLGADVADRGRKIEKRSHRPMQGFPGRSNSRFATCWTDLPFLGGFGGGIV